MKVIIAGGRDFTDYDRAYDDLSSLKITCDWCEIVSGCAKGGDKMGEWWADSQGFDLTKFPADWDQYGKSAGPIRNQQMAQYADALVAFWDGESRGTKSMIELALKAGLNVHVFQYDKEEPCEDL